MTAIQNFRVAGFVTGLAIKAPCLINSIVNLTLSAAQTVNGLALLVGDRVLVMAQTDPIENGIYTVETSAWNRAGDWDGNRDAVDGTLILLTNGTEVTIYQMRTSSDPFEVGVSTPTFTLLPWSDYESGTFTINWDGYNSSVTSTATYRKIGNMVLLALHGAVVTGTSDAVTKQSTPGDMPVSIIPAEAQIIGVAKTADNGGVFQYGEVQIFPTGAEIRVFRDAVSAAWTASGTATINAFNLVYYL